MLAWRGGMVAGLLVVGCGGPLPEQDEATNEALAWTEPAFSATDETGAVSASTCAPDAQRTQRVATLLPPSQEIPRYAPSPENLVDFRGALYFTVPAEQGGSAMWKSDGSATGTVAVTRPGTSGPEALGALTPAGDRLFFVGVDATHGQELWVSDGTTGGTRFVKDLTPGTGSSSLTHLTGLGRTLVFLRERPDTQGVELWKSDGTSTGTVLLRELGAETSVNWQDARLGGALLFFATDARGLALWKTDGTSEGTVRLKLLDGGPDSANVFDVRTAGSQAFFTLVETDGSTEVWKTDGTAAGTARLDTFGPTRHARLLNVLGHSLFITVTSEGDQRMALYRVALADGQQTRITTLPNAYASEGEAFPSLELVARTSGRLYFTVTIGSAGPAPRDTQLWVTDGTASGTKLLRRPLSLSDEYGSPLLAVKNDLVFFSASDSTAGIEPWVTNGTPTGTHRLKDIAPSQVGGASFPRDFTRVGDRVFFTAYDETRAGQLWAAPLPSTCASVAREPAE